MKSIFFTALFALQCAVSLRADSPTLVAFDSSESDATGQKLQNAVIWSLSATPGAQAYVAFRRSFTLDRVPKSVQLNLFADSRYLLWVNGTNILRGPCRFNPKRPEFDTLDLRPWLRPGTNTIAALVHSYPSINGRIMRHAPGVAAVVKADGQELLRTDSSWRCCAATEYQASPAAWSSIPDVIDARKSPGRWMTPEFADGAWEHTVPVSGKTWGPFLPRSIPLPKETVLSNPKIMPTAMPLTLPLQLRNTTASTEGTQSVVLDLGKMAMAYPSIELEADAGSVLQLQYALRYQNGRPAETYGVGTTYTARAGRQSFVAADQWCARYVTVSCPSGRVTLLGLKMTERRYPFERVGRFECNDEMLNRLWDRAVNTIEAVTDDAYGSDARERNEWLQDPAEPNFITTSVALAGPGDAGRKVYSDPRLLKNLLRHAALTQLADGRILATFPTDRGPEDCHYVIEDYSCQWIEALRLYYEATGDKEFLREMWPVLVKQMNWFLDRRTARGLVLAREYTSFDDPLAYITCEGAALNAFVFRALRHSANLARVEGEQALAEKYDNAATALAGAINENLWNESEGTYNSAFLGDKLLGPTSHAALLALDRGVVPPARVARVRHWFLANFKRAGGSHCCQNPDFRKMISDRAGINMPVTYYWVFQELYRMDSAARDCEALSEMRRRWGRMVHDSDDTGTLCETFGGPESCHNYGAVPAYFLSSYVLGVRRNGPVWDKQLIIEPHLADLSEAQGVVVTEFGPVPVAWKRQNDELVFKFDAPENVRTTLRLPDGDATTLELDGKKIRAEMQGRYVVAPVAAGSHEGRIVVKPLPQHEAATAVEEQREPSDSKSVEIYSKTTGDSECGLEGDVMRTGHISIVSTSEENVAHDGGEKDAGALFNGTTRNGIGGGETRNDGKTFRGYGNGSRLTVQFVKPSALTGIQTFAGHQASSCTPFRRQKQHRTSGIRRALSSPRRVG